LDISFLNKGELFMLEWFLSYEDKDNFITAISLAIFTGLLLLAFWIKINEDKHKVISKIIGSLALILPIFIVLSVAIIKINTKETYISNSDWKVVYKKGDEINIEILFDGDFFYNNFNVNTDENLKENYKGFTIKYDKSLNKKGTLIARKNNTDEKKKILLNKENIITDNPLNEESRIIKIEYLPITGKRKEAFGYYGKELKSSVEGEIRLTIENNNKEKEELKNLFKD
jgi:hypothetical protein